MPGTNMARTFDRVAHPLPGMLTPGPGSPTVIVGFQPAWRGIPLMMAAGLQAAKAVSDAVVNSATAAATAAMGTPAAPAAKAAEAATKAAASAAMGALINGLASVPSPSGGTPDVHVCATPPVPPPPHGPGVVIDGNPTVLVNGLPACQVGDKVLEALGPPDPIVAGCPTVIIGTGAASAGGGLMDMIAAVIGAAVEKALDLLSMASEVMDRFAAAAEAAIEAATQFARTVADAIVDGVNQLIENVRNFIDPPPVSPETAQNFHTQEQSNSCVIATSRNIIQYHTGEDIPESQLRDEMRDIMGDPDHNFETNGINPIHAQELLERHGVDSTVRRNQSLDDLEAMVADGEPVMVGFRNPGHRVALSGVETDADGNRTFVVMDPAGSYGGTPRRMTEAQFQNRYNQNAIVIEPD